MGVVYPETDVTTPFAEAQGRATRTINAMCWRRTIAALLLLSTAAPCGAEVRLVRAEPVRAPVMTQMPLGDEADQPAPLHRRVRLRAALVLLATLMGLGVLLAILLIWFVVRRYRKRL